MTPEDRLKYLIQRHRSLDEEITMLYEAGEKDSHITELKKLKLRLKEQINATKHGRNPQGNR